MPWNIQKVDGEFCVFKEGADKPLHCYPDEGSAKDYLAALYANENKGLKAAGVSVNSAGVAHARSLIASGKINDGAWDFSTADGDALLGANGDDWANYGKWFLAIHGDQPENTKGRYGYPFGKGGEVYRRAVAAAEARASAAGATDVASTASSLFEKLPDNSGKAMQRAYSTFVIKGMNEELRSIEGIASTPTTDRMGDVVKSEGANYTLPLPLLWQHDSMQPVGHVTDVKATKNGINIVAQFVKVNEPGKLKDRLDEAWQSVKHGLVRGLSIGFTPIESKSIGPQNFFGGAQEYNSWNWLELSCVTIPANAEASITAIKAIDTALRVGKKPVVRLDAPVKVDIKSKVPLKDRKAGITYL